MNEVTVTRKKIKNAYIRVLPPDGRIAISAPLEMPDAQIERLIREKSGWIVKRQEEIRRAAETTHLWGKPVELKITAGNSKTKGIRYQYEAADGCIFIKLSRPADEDEIRAVLEGIYKQETIKKMKAFIPEAQERTGLYADSWHVKSMKTRWGSCKMSEKKIAISSRLAAYPEECLMHVMIHELCHLLVSGHGRDFYALMDRFCPDWKRERKILKERY